MRQINGVYGTAFDSTRKGYVRVEKVKVATGEITENTLTVEGEVIDKEYYGIFTKYLFKIGEQKIKCLEKNDGKIEYKVGDKLNLYINKTDILQY